MSKSWNFEADSRRYETERALKDGRFVTDEEDEASRNNLVQAQPAPVANNHPAVCDLVITDMRARDQFGLDKYKTRLQPHNGRDALVDAYQELLDGAVYLRQLIYERDGK